jgi:hypothetical protein
MALLSIAYRLAHFTWHTLTFPESYAYIAQMGMNAKKLPGRILN